MELWSITLSYYYEHDLWVSMGRKNKRCLLIKDIHVFQLYTIYKFVSFLWKSNCTHADFVVSYIVACVFDVLKCFSSLLCVWCVEVFQYVDHLSAWHSFADLITWFHPAFFLFSCSGGSYIYMYFHWICDTKSFTLLPFFCFPFLLSVVPLFSCCLHPWVGCSILCLSYLGVVCWNVFILVL